MTEGPVDLATVALMAAFNPAAILVALIMGAKADALGKLPVAAFAGALAGVALVWILAALHVEAVAKPARAAGGMFVLQIVFGLAWAAIGYRFLRRSSS